MPKKTTKLALSGHVLSVNTRAYNKEEFDFADFEPFVRALTGGREYQYEAIKELLIYLWGGRYKTVLDLAKENYDKPEKLALRQRFQSKDHFLSTIPLPDKLSGVCHMATGTGKSYVMIAIAYISLLLDRVDRVLVLGPSSTIIEQGLKDKFSEYLYGETGIRLKDYLPEMYRNTVIKLLNSNDPIEDQSIVIENINAVWSEEKNSLGDTLFGKGNRVLVLSDEVHHAYSHLKFTGSALAYDFDEEKLESSSRQTTEGEERLWMKYLRDKPIKWHLGFTGTPYNKNEFFSDVLFNYTIKEAEEQKFIKKINAVIKIKDGVELSKKDRLQQIIQTHVENQKRFSFLENGKRRLKPITIFISQTQPAAKNIAAEFATELAEYYGKHDPLYQGKSRAELEAIANDKIIVVTSDANKTEYQSQLDQIEEIDPNKTGGNVEFISAVNKLSEGWDVDNVFQIVPAHERAFSSKLLISQVIGRGLRLPRNIPMHLILQDYPEVTVTNHEKFGPYVQDLYDEVTDCELRLHARPLEEPQPRHQHHFVVFNTTYSPINKTTQVTETKPVARTLKLEPQPPVEPVNIKYLKDTKQFKFDKEFVTVGQAVNDVTRKYKNVAFERQHFDFNDDTNPEDLPTREGVEATIKDAMRAVGISSNHLSRDNAKRVMLHFSQLIGTSKKKVIRENQGHSVYGLSTELMPIASVNSGRVGSEITVFLSEEYQHELMNDDLFVLEHIANEVKESKKSEGEQATLFAQYIEAEDIRPLIQERGIYLVNPHSFKSPQALVATSHNPEKDFVTGLIQHSKYLNGWVKSPDSGFYSLEYFHLKKGKDRVSGSFNPDFFITTDTTRYLQLITHDPAKEYIRDLEEKHGTTTLVFVAELKATDDDAQITHDKEKAAISHFDELNERLNSSVNRSNLEDEFRDKVYQWYTFNLVRENQINDWFRSLREGTIVLNP